MNIQPAWTDERVTTLKDWATAGLTASQIGAEMGITRNSVIGKLGRIGVPLAGAPTNPKKQRAPRVHNPLGPHGLRARRKSPAPAQEPEPEIIDLPPDESAFACTLLELTPDACRFPLGDPSKPEFRFCGEQHVGGPYCRRHHRLAHKANNYRGSWG
jgi:GcrA cell cycle regulator